jgi:hypothetical protein
MIHGLRTLTNATPLPDPQASAQGANLSSDTAQAPAAEAARQAVSRASAQATGPSDTGETRAHPDAGAARGESPAKGRRVPQQLLPYPEIAEAFLARTPADAKDPEASQDAATDQALHRGPLRRRDTKPYVPPLRPRVDIPLRTPCPDAANRMQLIERGRHLARQDAWDELIAETAEAEARAALTPGLLPVAQLLAEGARSDASRAACDAVGKGDLIGAQAILTALESMLEDMPDSAIPLYTLAMAHVDVALALRGASAPEMLSAPRRKAYQHHMQAARNIVEVYDPFELASPLWAALRCAVLEADPAPSSRVADDYEDLIELDPRVPHHLRALGRDCRPQRFGTWEVLDREARRVTAQTADIWGVGGYTWVYIGALEMDEGAFRRIDTELFTEGLHNILEAEPTQDMANRLCAFTGLTLGGPSEPGSPRERIAEAFGWISQDHLREIHPAIWSAAPTQGHALTADETNTSGGLSIEDCLKRGRARAISSLAQFYAPALDNGRRLVVNETGLRMLKGD